jgi:hypothetical protein
MFLLTILGSRQPQSSWLKSVRPTVLVSNSALKPDKWPKLPWVMVSQRDYRILESDRGPHGSFSSGSTELVNRHLEISSTGCAGPSNASFAASYLGLAQPDLAHLDHNPMAFQVGDHAGPKLPRLGGTGRRGLACRNACEAPFAGLRTSSSEGAPTVATVASVWRCF